MQINPDIKETKDVDAMIDLLKELDPKLRRLDPEVALAVLCCLSAKYMVKGRVSAQRFLEQVMGFKIRFQILGMPTALEDPDEHPR
jgi:hypothetical protein